MLRTETSTGSSAVASVSDVSDESLASSPTTLSTLHDAVESESVAVRPKDRTSRILSAVGEKDIEQLRQLAAEPGGFVNEELRKLVWPILLGVNANGKGKGKDGPPSDHREEPATTSQAEVSIAGSASGIAAVVTHPDEGQVSLDVNRSFVSFPDVVAAEKDRLRVELELVIVTVLRQHPALRYFQGFHDIVSILLLTFNDAHLTMLAVEAMSLHRIRDNMGKGLDPVLGYLRLLNRILTKADPALAEIVQVAAALPYFSLSWVLTLMSHDITSLSTISRLFDFLLAHNPAMVSYLGVAIIILKKQEISDLDEEDSQDPAVLHHTLSRVPNLQDTSIIVPAVSSLEDSYVDEDLLSKMGGSTSSSSMFDEEYEDDYGSSWQSRSRRTSIVSDSIDAFEDSMLYDPDVFGPAFLSPQRTRPPQRKIRRSPSPSPSRSPFARPPSPPPPVIPSLPIISLDDLITATLALYAEFPLLGDEEKSVRADEVMGPKSCVFTWPLSCHGLVSDADADEIACKGEDIVIPEGNDRLVQEELEKVGKSKELRKREERNRRRRMNMGVGVTLAAILGAVVILYGFELKEVGSGAKEWKLRSFSSWF